MKLYQAKQLFLMDRVSYCSGKTMQYYDENIERFFFYLGEIQYCQPELLDCDIVTREVVLNYVTFLRTTGVKNTSVNTYFRAVKTFLNYCIDEDLLDPDVLRKVKFLRSDQKPILPLSIQEVETVDNLLNLKTETGLRNYCIFHLMLDAGFRAGDVVKLRVCDVSFKNNNLIVQGKGDKYRAVLLAPGLKKQLYKYLVYYRPYVFEDSNSQQTPFFTQIASQEYLNLNCIKQFFARLKKKSGIDRLHPHLLRHTFATSYILGGGNLEFLRLMLGHSDFETTKLYLHLAQTSKMLGVEVYHLDPVFFKTVY